MNTPNEHSPKCKVFGVGLGRTGTLSLHSALETLGFGPCHHPITVGLEAVEWGKFAKAAKEGASREFLDDLYRGYSSAVDNTTAIIAKSLYTAYPDAKFILTVREPAKWAESMRKTVLRVMTAVYYERERRFAEGTATEDDFVRAKKSKALGLSDWITTFHEDYHQNRLQTDTEGEIIRHNQYIMNLIPSEKLLVFNVADGWEPLTQFLGVLTPDKPFPRVNDSDGLQTHADNWVETLRR